MIHGLPNSFGGLFRVRVSGEACLILLVILSRS
jgi:hypothetical protein